ncbi:hypothetical protein GALL_506150 [mine drainage metagenome]|uniref:Transposase n=1 Tax=mine drainage metagenome TaxID=410659 RepID=A0A1J5PW32_9ZZZZ
MKKEKLGVPPIYANSLKIAVAREYLTSNLSAGELRKKYNLPYSDCVHYFVRWYKNKCASDEKILNINKADTAISIGTNDSDLLKQLNEANLKIVGLEMLIEIAQKELGIDIIKKSGTKQLTK